MRRTALAAALVAAALALPLGAWWLSGSREARREAEALRSRPLEEARAEAGRLAALLAGRLEALRQAEDRRPWQHYQNLYHEPKGAYEGQSVVPSPLAQGPEDPLVRAHFQVEAGGALTLPTLNTQIDELNRDNEVQWRGIQTDLAPLAAQCAPGVSSQKDQGPAQAQVLDEDSWSQNAKANAIWRDLKSSSRKGQAQEMENKQGKAVSIRWTPFAWKTLTAKAGPGLFALRTVSTPDGETTQGFEVSEERLADFLKGARLPARLLPGPPGNPAEARLPLEGAEWCVAVSVPDTGKGAEAVQASFRRRFLGGASLVLLAGVCVVALVHQAERLAGQRSRFAASAAHELRTPLAGLRMYGEMLAEGLGDPARAGDYARRISAEAERLGRVVSNVLGFTRLERGGLSARPETGDLATALREMAERQKPGLEAAGASLVLEIPAGALPACFDRDALAQVVQNLLDNAEKHARGAADRRILLSLKPVGGGAEVSVSDRGPGVPAALRGRLFRPFARGGSSDAPEGLGLGLSVSKALAEAQGGRLSFSPAEGGGAVFTVFLSA